MKGKEKRTVEVWIIAPEKPIQAKDRNLIRRNSHVYNSVDCADDFNINNIKGMKSIEKIKSQNVTFHSWNIGGWLRNLKKKIIRSLDSRHI